ncbi:MAG: GerAB/ArcD/ProY family transporter [Clostridia bacterium]|nr:GerAB/ArcD/ProY family transporter [Clostridia bacterium]
MINEKNKTGLFYVCALVSAFSVANGLITAPFNERGILPFFAAAVAGAAVLSVAAVILRRIFCGDNSIAAKVICVLLAALIFVSALLAAREYCFFVYSVVLYRSNIIAVKIIFALCAFCLAVSGEKAVFKFSLISVLAVAVIFAVLFLLSLKTFDFKNLSGAFDLSGLNAADIFNYFKTMFMPSLAAVTFAVLSLQKPVAGGVIFGAGFGVILCLAVIFDVVLSFGMPLAGKLDYPYISDISTVTVGSLYTRMDGFAYAAFFICYLIKTGVSIKCAAMLLKRVGVKSKFIPAALMSAALVVI